MADNSNQLRDDGLEARPADTDLDDSYQRLQGFLRHREPREVRISDIRAKYAKKRQGT